MDVVTRTRTLYWRAVYARIIAMRLWYKTFYRLYVARDFDRNDLKRFRSLRQTYGDPAVLVNRRPVRTSRIVYGRVRVQPAGRASLT